MKDDEIQFLKIVYQRCNQIIDGQFVKRERVRDVISEIEIHHKRCWYLLKKWAEKDWYDYGITLDLGWLTPSGVEKARELI